MNQGQHHTQNDGMKSPKYIVKSNMINPHNGQVRPYVLCIGEFIMPAPNGVGTVSRSFKDDSGQPDILRVEENGIVWVKENPFHAQNIALLNDLIKINHDVAASVKIVDEDSEAEVGAERYMLIAEAIGKIKLAKEQNNADLLYGLARMLMPSAQLQTLPVVYKFLLDKAATDPKALLDSLIDRDFELKINTLKAIDMKFIEKTSEGIYTYNGQLIARSFDDLIMFLKENPDLSRNIFFRIKGISSPLSVSTRVEPISEQIVPVSDLIPDVEATQVNNQNRFLNLTGQVKRWIEAGLLEERETGFYYNNIPLGKDNKEIAKMLLGNEAIENHLKQLYSETKEAAKAEKQNEVNA